VETFAKADIFFFVTTIAVVLLTIFLIALASYAIFILHKIKKLYDRVEKGIDSASIEVKDLIENVRESSLFQFFFSKRSNRKKRVK
jgi:hypothetical protein